MCASNEACLIRATVKRKSEHDDFSSEMDPHYLGRECGPKNNTICDWQEMQKCKKRPGDELTLECGHCCDTGNCTITKADIGKLINDYMRKYEKSSGVTVHHVPVFGNFLFLLSCLSFLLLFF